MKLKENKQKPIKAVCLVFRPKSTPELADILPNLIQWLTRRNIEVCLFDYEADRVEQILRKSLPKNINLIDRKLAHSSLDLFITLGGDGTLIGIGRECSKNSPPVMGINLGNLGFITEFSKLDFYDHLEGIIRGEYETIKISQFRAEVLRKSELRFKGYFLNDSVVNKNDISRLFSLSLFNEDEHIYDLSGDGLILSTPVGSTAYSLAAGGPIIHPNVDAIVITPICPHSLTHRPLVVNGSTKIKIKLKDMNGTALMTLDGQEVISITPDDQIVLQKEDRRFLKLITNPEKAYFSTLKSKLTHGRR